MPRDLKADKEILEGMPHLSREPNVTSSHKPVPAMLLKSPPPPKDERTKKLGDIHPFAQLLNEEDLDDCDWLEHTAFEPHEAATREKIEYRLKTCGELCSGLFTSAYATSPGPLGEVIKARTFPPIDASDADRKRLLIGHIIATKSDALLVTDDTMDWPKDYRTNYQLTPKIGHNEDGQTICLHSLCIHPSFAGKGLGQVLLKSYVQRVKGSGVGKRIAIICREKLIRFYEREGFKSIGPSKCSYAGGDWIDMVLEFEDGEHDF